MKILSVLNLSNREKPGCDSGVIFHRLLFERVATAGIEVAIASPISLKISGTRDVPFEVGRSKYDVRFRFDWEAAERLIGSERPDVIFVHQVELVANYRALLQTMGLSPKLVTYCHYWPILERDPVTWDDSLDHGGLAKVILARIVDAASMADLFFVTSQWARDLLKWTIERTGSREKPRTTRILNCPADPEFISILPRRKLGNKTVLYNHRLYRQYGTEFFIELASDMAAQGVSFVVTDFFSVRNKQRQALERHATIYRQILESMPNVYLRSDGDIREIYRREIVGGVDVALAPYRKNANWSMSAVDCMGLGVPVACPPVGALPELTPPTLQFRTKEEGIELIARLLADDVFWAKASRQGQAMARSFSADIIARQFISAVSE